MKRLKYLGNNRRITSFTYDDSATGEVVIVIETSNNELGIVKHNSVSLPIEHLEKFVQEYKSVTEKVKFAGLAGLDK